MKCIHTVRNSSHTFRGNGTWGTANEVKQTYMHMHMTCTCTCDMCMLHAHVPKCPNASFLCFPRRAKLNRQHVTIHKGLHYAPYCLRLYKGEGLFSLKHMNVEIKPGTPCTATRNPRVLPRRQKKSYHTPQSLILHPCRVGLGGQARHVGDPNMRALLPRSGLHPPASKDCTPPVGLF